AMNVPKNEFIWADGEVRDFYLAVDVKLTPDNRNAGIQFRSKKADATGQALGYQADVGAGVWGKLYHEHGRGKLDWNNRAAKAVKRDDWNRYEILAVGHKIWTAINGTLCVAIEDPEGELSGKIAFQVHAGPPQTVHYRPVRLVHDPKLELPGLNENQLLDALPKKVVKEDKPKPKPGWTPQVTAWRTKLDANDPGMIGKWFANVFDDSKWKRMKLPTFYETAGLPGHDGTVWFRRAIDIPGPHAGKPLTLELGPIDDMDMTWFNGIQVGGIERPGFWTAPRKYTVPGKLVKTGRNVITVRVIDHGWSGGFGAKTTQMRMSASGLKPVSIAGSWKYQEGITLKALELGALTNPTPPKPIPPPPPAPSLVRPLAKTTSPAPAFTNGFQIEGDANIVIVGSANAAESQRHGYLETLLTAAHPAQRLAIRNMAWPADTVYQQQRPRNFFSAIKPSYGEADRRKPLPA
ncbi:MAG TPA: family 16 glycoside hydrolase, partial [Verrucomicrobiota bacterium]|nr:family 16 glycoside hydrolase [Verrucomicrobiota bacterium]